MGIYGFINKKTKNIEEIREDLKHTEMLTEELEIYDAINKKYEKSVDKELKLGEISERSRKKSERASDTIKNINKKMRKMRNKHTFFKRLRYSRIFFWSKEGKKYRALKKRLASAKESKKFADKAFAAAQAKIKIEDTKNKSLQKQLKSVEKELRKSWYENSDSIKFIKEYKANKEKIKEIYGKEERKAIEDCIKRLQENGGLSVEKSKVLATELHKALKSKNKHDTRYSFIGVMEKEKENENEHEKENKVKKEEKSKTKKKEKNEKEKEKDKNHFKEELDVKAFTKNHINVNTMETALQNLDVKLTPKEFLYFIATLNFENNNLTNAEETKQAAKKLRKQIINKEIDEEELSNEFILEKGAQIFKKANEEKKLTQKEAGSRIAYQVAQEYKEIKKMENIKEQPEIQKEQQDGRTD